jgi:hypothetical protein
VRGIVRSDAADVHAQDAVGRLYRVQRTGQ